MDTKLTCAALRIPFLIGAFALGYSVLHPPVLEAGKTLLLLLVFCVSIGSLIFTEEKTALARPKQLFACLAPWLLAAMFMGNSKLDRSREVLHQTMLLETHYGRKWDTLIVRSWRSGRETESIYVKTFFFPKHGFFYSGKLVTIGTREGAFGFTWVSTVEQQWPRLP